LLADWTTKSGRLPYIGVPVTTEGQEHVHSVVGPMARTLKTLTTVTKMVVEAQPWRLDPRCLPIPWRDEHYREVQSRPLVIGLLLDDGVVKVHPPIDRALREMEAKLIAAGHEVVHWEPSGHQTLIEIMVRNPLSSLNAAENML
jgi:amidase